MSSEVYPAELYSSQFYHGESIAPVAPVRPFWQQFLDTIGFTVEDLMWSAALWLAVIGLAPFLIFYALLVN